MIEKSKEFYEFKKMLDFLKKQKGEGTELISVYIQPGANVNEVVARLRDEYGQAMNIKSKQTRKNVQAAIEKIIGKLKGVFKPPENGVAIFCGNIKGKIELYTVIPPQPLLVQLYRCDSSFLLDPLLEITESKEVYGLFTMDRREATIALLKGKQVEIISHLTSGIPGKHTKGGQSQRRFERIIEQAAEEFYKRICEHLNQVMRDPKIKGIIAGGPGLTKFNVVNSEKLNSEVRKKIIGTIDTSYTDEFGIKELVDKSEEVVQKLEIQKEKNLVNKFIKEVVIGGLATYGINEVKNALETGKVDMLLLSEKIDEKIIEELSESAEKVGAKIEMISEDTPEGKQFHAGFGGIGALLRYK